MLTLIERAENYLNDRTPKQAMPLFNKAYLLDSTNADVYWGLGCGRCSYGSDYYSTDWYDIGLALDSNKVNLLRAYAHYEWSQYRSLQNWGLSNNRNERDSIQYLNHLQERFENAEGYFLKALAIVPDHLKTMSNLADLHLDKVDCTIALSYYQKSKTLYNNCSAQCFERQLTKKCGSVL